MYVNLQNDPNSVIHNRNDEITLVELQLIS